MTRNSERHLRRSTRQKNNPPSKPKDHSRKTKVENAAKTPKRKRESSVIRNDIQSTPPIKRSRRLSNSKENSSDENTSSLTSKSFYGKAGHSYLTPIQRRDIGRHTAKENAEPSLGKQNTRNSKQQGPNSEKENNLSISNKNQSNTRRKAGKSRNSSSSDKSDLKKLRSDVLKKLSPSAVIKVLDLSTATESGEEKSIVKIEDTPQTNPQSRKNKFFKHKSPGKKAKIMLAKHGVSRKGFSLSFQSKKVNNDSITETVSKKPSNRALTSETKCDMARAAENLRKNKEKLRQLKKNVNKVQENDTDDLTSVRSDHVNSPSVESGYVPDFAEDDDEIVDDADISADLTVSEITHIQTEPDETSNGRTSAMSNCSDKWSTCSTGADSVMLLPEPSSDERKFGSVSVLPDSVLSKSEVSERDFDDTQSICTTEREEAKTLGNLGDNEADDRSASEAMDLGNQSSQEGSITDTEVVHNQTVNIKETVASKKLFPIFNPSAQSSPHLRRTPCTPPVSSGLKSVSPSPQPTSSLLDTSSSQSCSSSARSSPKHTAWRKTISRDKDGMEQMMLDCGQKLMGPQPCSFCGMMYTRGDAEDESSHSKIHQRFINILRFPGWNKERVVQQILDGSKILMILPEDKKCIKKVSAVMQLVDRDLGFVVRSSVPGKESTQSITTPCSRGKFFLFISADKRVVGFCAVQVITKGYRVLSEQAVDQRMSTSPTKRQRPRCCSTKAEPARCGINRIWVLHSERRKGIASQLLDSVRFNFVVGNILKPEELAFSDPTPNGLRLATSYTGTPHFLVYKPV